MKRKVRVVTYDPAWKDTFAEAELELRTIFEEGDIHHIGSTSVEGLSAKPIIDILIEVDHIERADEETERMEHHGYVARGEHGIPGRRFFYKGEGEERSLHIHTFEKGSDGAKRHLAFRDYLRSHPDVKEEYGTLKTLLVKKHPESLEDYMDGKDPFIKTVEKEALVWRYSDYR
ncbi:GrpB family protein [Alteribacter aurantiacus]|uniref:GrpB family protein n=1 Tax=Alteribacter aurantiacus TaxID=254410 RepID=UPI000423D3F2|nr:GrpB family protein [Alteribacter aurantiacus]